MSLGAGVRQFEKSCGFGGPACSSSKKVVALESGVRSSKKLALFLAVGHSPYKEKKR